MLPNPKPYQHANLYPDPNSSLLVRVPRDAGGQRAEHPGSATRTAATSSWRSTAPTPTWADTRPPARSSSTTRSSPTRARRTRSSPARTAASRTATTRSRSRTSRSRREPGRPSSRTRCTRAPARRSRSSTASTSPTRDYLGDAGVGPPVLHRDARRRDRAVRRGGPRPVQPPAPAGRRARDAGGAVAGAVQRTRQRPRAEPETTPARNPPLLERYFNNKWNIVGSFKPPEVRAQIPSAVETGLRRRSRRRCS